MAAAFFGSAVEAVEAMTVVLAVAITRGWRSALSGALAAIGVVGAAVAIAGPAIQSIHVQRLQVLVGSLLLLFGIRWLRKAILRTAGVIPLRDEDVLFREAATELHQARAGGRWSLVAAAASFKAVLLEGLEVVIIVIGVGAGGSMLGPASIGAAAACVLVAGAALLLHRPLSRVPENTLKFAVGGIMAAFGLFWFGEGIGIQWPYADAAILGLMAIIFSASCISVELAKVRR